MALLHKGSHYNVKALWCSVNLSVVFVAVIVEAPVTGFIQGRQQSNKTGHLK